MTHPYRTRPLRPPPRPSHDLWMALLLFGFGELVIAGALGR